jgi:hypothetical protein
VKPWRDASRDALVSGSLAAVLSGVALAVCGALERSSPAGPLNGPSQWVYGRMAAHRRRPLFRHTVVGYAIHHIVSVGWAALHEKHVTGLFGERSTGARFGAAAVTAGLACLVDYQVAQGRARPGFEKQLSRKSLFAAYAAFAVGLALRPVGRQRRPASPYPWDAEITEQEPDRRTS